MTLIRAAIPVIAAAAGNTCACQSTLALGIWSDRSKIDDATRERLAPLLGRYLEKWP